MLSQLRRCAKNLVTPFFKTIHAFVIVHHEKRRVVHIGVTKRPTDDWITQQVRDHIRGSRDTYRRPALHRLGS